ncbi:hypothetical protein BC629DRAFT_1440140 [Irpex lacteus]|nr:hypothetical protein BC629DRAFT_1440140 [Irpex lacteus]
MPPGKNSPRKTKSSTSDAKREKPVRHKSVSPTPRKRRQQRMDKSSSDNVEEELSPEAGSSRTRNRRSPRKHVTVEVPSLEKVKRARGSNKPRKQTTITEEEDERMESSENGSGDEADNEQARMSMSPEVPWPGDSVAKSDDDGSDVVEYTDPEVDRTSNVITKSKKGKGKQAKDAEPPTSSRNTKSAKGKGKQKDEDRSAVTFVDHKFKHPGTLPTDTWDNIETVPDEDDVDEGPATPYDNSPPPPTTNRTLLRKNVQRAPNDKQDFTPPSTPIKKKSKRVLDDEDDEAEDEKEAGDSPLKGITGKLHKSGLSSPKKSRPSRMVSPERNSVMEDMVSSLNITNIQEHLCPSLAGTYEGLPLLERAATQVVCAGGPDLAVNKLREYLHRVHIRDNSPQERQLFSSAIVEVVTAPSFGKLIHNPARADWRKFTMHVASNQSNSSRSSRVYFTYGNDNDEKVCFILYGGATNCSTFNPKEMGTSGYIVKGVPLSPTCLEWARAFNFLAHLMGFTLMHITGWNGSVDVNTHSAKADDAGQSSKSTNPFAATAQKTTRTSQGTNPVDYRFVSGDKTERLNNRLRAIINKGGLSCNEEVPVFDMRKWFRADGTPSDINTPDMFLARLADAPQYKGEIPQSHHNPEHGTHNDLRFSLVGMNHSSYCLTTTTICYYNQTLIELTCQHSYYWFTFGRNDLDHSRDCANVFSEFALAAYTSEQYLYILLYRSYNAVYKRNQPTLLLFTNDLGVHISVCIDEYNTCSMPRRPLMANLCPVTSESGDMSHELAISYLTTPIDNECPVIASTVTYLVPTSGLVMLGTKNEKPMQNITFTNYYHTHTSVDDSMSQTAMSNNLSVRRELGVLGFIVLNRTSSSCITNSFL